MEDWDISYPEEFCNNTIKALEPFLKKIGFKYAGNTFKYSWREYDHVKVYKYEMGVAKHIFGKQIQHKYPIHFIFYDNIYYPFATNSLNINSKYTVSILKPVEEYGNYDMYETLEEILNGVEYAHRYFLDENDAKKFNKRLISKNKKFYSIRD